MQTLKAGGLYFALVFGAGFVLGTVRVLWVVPRVGERAAELMESPVMLAVSIIAARWIVRRFALPLAFAQRLGVGLVALAFLVAMEFGFVLRVRGMTIGEYFASRDRISGSVYCLLLVLFALMPLLVYRTESRP